MTNKTIVIIAASIMAVLTGGGITYAVLTSGKKTNGQTKLSAATNKTNATTQDTTSPSLSMSTQDSNVSLQSNLGQSSGSNASNSMAGPEAFSEYDQYKTAQTAMYGDAVVGTGLEVTNGTKVQVTYKGWLTNGKLFDQSTVNEQGQTEAFTFTVGDHKVIPGWEQAIVGMKVGGSRRFIIPPAVGYGAEGNTAVPPNSVLVFDVTLHAAL